LSCLLLHLPVNAEVHYLSMKWIAIAITKKMANSLISQQKLILPSQVRAAHPNVVGVTQVKKLLY